MRGFITGWLYALGATFIAVSATFAQLPTAQIPTAQEAPDIQELLNAGRLSEGERAIGDWLRNHPDDDKARFELGVVQFLRTFEHLGASLYEHGLRTDRMMAGFPPLRNDAFPQNPKPKKTTYADMRKIVETWVADLEKAETTLAQVRRTDVKLPLQVALIKIDLTGQGTPVSAAALLRRDNVPRPQEESEPDPFEEFVIAFDRGDVNWLRGYCHLLAAWGDVALALDGQEIFDCTAHLAFENVDSPHAYLQGETPARNGIFGDSHLIMDIIAWVHLLRFPIQEPERMTSALEHLEAMIDNGKEMWKHYQAETDDDREWIPNPKQKNSVTGVAVTEEMLETWLDVLDESEQVLAGKKLIPFWRGGPAEKRGVNLRRAFTESRQLDIVLWIQGTAATPYLEKGEITNFADPRTWRRLDGAFGGLGDFFGFAIWFN